MARPRKHDRPKIVKDICAKIASGQLVKDACAEHGIDSAMLRQWTAAEPRLATLYARAREDQAHALAEQAVEIANGADEEGAARVAEMVEAVHGAEEEDKAQVLRALTREAVQRDKLRVDTRKWMASKIAPRMYGEKITTELTGEGGGPVKVEQQVWKFGDKQVAF